MEKKEVAALKRRNMLLTRGSRAATFNFQSCSSGKETYGSGSRKATALKTWKPRHWSLEMFLTRFAADLLGA